jgi:predicted phage baseplate assembly protein
MTSDRDSCGCCEGREIVTPGAIDNAPGLPAIRVRAGDHGRFKEAMLANLGRQAALAGLTTRDDDDPAIGIVDAWAVTLDVLTFYDERIANEGYLRTATERRSVLELARAIGYELAPGVAASTHLAFALETTEGSPESVTIPIGVRAQSIPGQDESPQTFETVAEIEARPAWNALRPKLRQSHIPAFGEDTIQLEGTATGLKPGDALLLVGDERLRDPGSERWDFRRVKAVKVEDAPRDQFPIPPGRTIVTLDRGLGSVAPPIQPAANPTVYALRKRCALFGSNAADFRAMPKGLRNFYYGRTEYETATETQWPHFTLHEIALPQVGTESLFCIQVDGLHEDIVAGSWVVLAHPGYQELYEVVLAAEDARADFGLSGKTTRLTLKGENAAQFDAHVRETAVFGVSQALALAQVDVTTPVSGSQIELQSSVEGLQPGQWIAVSGTPLGTDASVSEVVQLGIEQARDATNLLRLASDLKHSYQRASVTVNANVAPATHGETRNEVLGSGSGALGGQSFQLKQSPLTYVSAATASGGKAALELRVGGIRWEEAPTLYRRKPGERIYTLRQSDDGKTTVRFGDGVNGARLPTGVENVAARYRIGTGKGGMVKAAQISMLMDRLLGLKSVLNPQPPSGAEDPETLERARTSAPKTVLTLDRIVSLRDFEDFARAFSGIAKAAATWLWDGEKRIVHVTVAGEGGTGIDATDTIYQNLIDAMDKARDRNQPLRIDSFQEKSCRLVARVRVDPAFEQDAVFSAVKARVAADFSFEARELGQALASSQVVLAMQQVDGVVAVDLDTLDFSPGLALKARLPANLAQKLGAAFAGAELLSIAANDIFLMPLTE